MQSRREMLRNMALAGAALAFPARRVLALSTLGEVANQAADRPYRAAAERAAAWIAESRIQTANGVTWPAHPNDASTVNDGLYSGSPGIVLFYLELFRLTGKQEYLREATAGADEIIAANKNTPIQPERAGLYFGAGGQLYVFRELAKLPAGERYQEAASHWMQRIADVARRVGDGVEWNIYTDATGGTASVGLVLLHAHDAGDTHALALARGAGIRLLSQGIPADGGLRWEMTPGYPRYMPNFSHGTAGIGYFLASLYRATRDRQFLDGALAAARHLEAIANTSNGGCIIKHDDREGKDIYYLGWCHGPVGTTRLFYRLGEITGDPAWNDWVRRGARGIMQSGIPEHLTPGFWNNVSQCCGNAAVAQFCIDLHRTYGGAEYASFGKRTVDNMLHRGVGDTTTLSWPQAENRKEPDNIIAQTGFMQGAAGMGMVLLHLDAALHGEKGSIVFPDSPFVV